MAQGQLGYHKTVELWKNRLIALITQRMQKSSRKGSGASIWDGPDAKPAREQEEGSCGRFSRMVLQGFEVHNK